MNTDKDTKDTYINTDKYKLRINIYKYAHPLKKKISVSLLKDKRKNGIS